MERIALFDFDGTLLPGDSIVHLIRFAARKKRIRLIRLFSGVFFGILFKLHIADETTSKNAALRFLEEMSREERDQLLEHFVQEKLIPLFYRDGLACIRDLHEKGNQIWLVSASTDHYMPMIAAYIGADQLLCTQTDQSGRILQNCKGQEKVRRIQEALSSLPGAVITEAYADSKSDLPMLMLAEKAIAVNPKRSLKRSGRFAETRSWKN